MKISIEQIRTEIEKNLNDFLPQTFNENWKNLCFGSLPNSILDKHINELVEPCKNLMSLGGKRWRPVLQILTGMLVAKNKNNFSENQLQLNYKLTPLVEFVHTASLIHDDIEDAADTRRGKPAAHITYGLDTALNAGSWLYFVAPTAIDAIAVTQNFSSERKNLFYKLFLTELRRLHLGQAMDIFWHKNPSIFPTAAEYQAMVQNKTGTLSCLAVITGVLAGGGSEEEALKAGEIARGIGEGFQILDDVQNLTTGNPGKKRGDDIVEGKKSLPVLIHIEKNPLDKEKISCYFQNARKNGIMDKSVEECIELLQKSGAIETAFEKGHALVKEKSRELIALFENSSIKNHAGRNENESENATNFEDFNPANEIINLFESMLPKITLNDIK